MDDANPDADPVASPGDDSQQDAGDVLPIESTPPDNAGDVTTAAPQAAKSNPGETASDAPIALPLTSANPDGDQPADSATPPPPPASALPDDDATPVPLSAETEPGETAPSPLLRPTPGTLKARIFDFIEKSSRPRRAWQVAKALELGRLPTPELSAMVSQGYLMRPREGCYAVVGGDYNAVMTDEVDT
jgi:hypothetical protein